MLRYKADIRTLGIVAVYFAATLGAWLWHPTEWYFIVPIVMTLCVLSFFGAAIVHNTIHVPIFRTKRANKIFQIILSYTYGHPVSAFVPGHNFSHHQHTQTALDDMRTDKLRFRWNLLNQLLFFFVVSGDITKSEIRFLKETITKKPTWFRQYMTEFVLVFGVKIALLIINWKLAVLYILIPHFYAVWGIVSVNYWQHDGTDESHPYNHSRNFTGGILNWLTMNNGYHSAHHDKPGLHWSLLPEYHEKHIVPNIHPNLCQTNLLKYLWITCGYPGKRIDYLGNPVVLKPVYQGEDWIPTVNMGPGNMQMGVEV